ncbi:OmpA family protein [Vibrio campbellii]
MKIYNPMTRMMLFVFVLPISIGIQAKSDWSISNRVYIPNEGAYELGVIKGIGDYELESSVRFPFISENDVSFSLGATRLVKVNEQSELAFGMGYALESPYVRYAYRYKFNNTVNLEAGYNYYFEDQVSDHDQIYLGFNYSFGCESCQKNSEVKSKNNEKESKKIVNKPIKKTVLQEPRETELVSKTVTLHFRFNKVLSNSIDILNAELDSIKQASGKIEVIGHSDAIGSESVNQIISYKRAVFIKKLLLENGIDEENMSVIGLGERNPIQTNQSEFGRAQNRRVVIRYNTHQYKRQ